MMNFPRPIAGALAGLLALSLARAALLPAALVLPVLVLPALAPQPAAAEVLRPRPAPNRPPLDAMPDGQPPTLSTTPAPPPATAEKPTRDPNRGAVTNLALPRYVTLKGTEGNARRGPGRTHRIDWVFTRSGMPLRVTAEYENWRLVEDVEGAGGWVHYSLLSGTRSALVMVDLTPFHSLPDNRSAVVFKAEKGVIARILQCKADWCRLLADGQRGWAEKSALWGVDPGEIVD
jgi:SH3-like domain-containing protein